jgi:general secretion pathway protein C
MDWKRKLSELRERISLNLNHLSSKIRQFFSIFDSKIKIPKIKIPFKKPWGQSLDEELRYGNENTESFSVERLKYWVEQAQEKTRSIIRDLKNDPKITKWAFNIKEQLTLLRKSHPRETLERIIQSVQKRGTPSGLITTSIILCAFFLADVLTLAIDHFIPEPPLFARPLDSIRNSFGPRASIEDYQIIVRRNLFSSEKRVPGGRGKETGEPVRTSLPISLIGTIILENELKSIATIEDKAASVVLPLRVQDEIPGKLRVTSIRPDRIIFLNLSNQQFEYADLPLDTITAPRLLQNGGAKPKTDGIQQTGAGQFLVPRSEIAKALDNLPTILTQARAIPHFENGVLAGYRLVEIVPNSIYTKLGLSENDIICGLNGQGLMDPGEAMRSLGELKNAKHMEICIKKPNGKQMNYAYDIQ